MCKAWLCVLALAVLAPASSVSASVVINEVLFNPSASANPGDTGLEKIEFYNNGDSPVDMSSWELYPDGIGYFIFPHGFTLGSKSFVTVHLRLSGANDALNLYHSSAVDNMGDSSGSVALFSGKPYSKDTIVDFTRYKKGTSDAKTWESAASSAGLWVAGQFIDISTLQAGNSIALTSDGVRGGVSLWQIASLPTMGSSNTGNGHTFSNSDSSDQEGAGQNSQSSAPAPLPAIAPPPALTAYAGEDRTAFQGALLEFRGRADDIKSQPLASGRFSWNFGDGNVREGRAVLHTYYFPGTYNVSLNVSSGEYTGADYLKVIVVKPDLVISEAKLGERGFIELYNNTAYRLDLGGFLLKDGNGIFAVERETYIDPKAALVFSNAATGLLFIPRQLTLHDAHNFVIETADFSLPLLLEESFERVSIGDNKFVKIKLPTPGAYSSVLASKALAPVEENRQKNKNADEEKVVTAPQILPSAGTVKNAIIATEDGGDNVNIETTALASGISSSILFFAASVVIGLLAAGGFLLFRL